MLRISASIALLALTCGVFPGALFPTQHAHGAPVRLPRSEQKSDDDKTDKMFPDGTFHDFGKVAHGTELTHAFRVVNTSKFPLRILEVRSSMNPIRAWINKSVLEPGEEASVEIAVDTNRFVGLRTMTLYLEMDHGGRPREEGFWIKAYSQQQP